MPSYRGWKNKNYPENTGVLGCFKWMKEKKCCGLLHVHAGAFSFLKLTLRNVLDLLRGGQFINISIHLNRVHNYTIYSKCHYHSFFFFSSFPSASPASLWFLFWDWNEILNMLRSCPGLSLYLHCLFCELVLKTWLNLPFVTAIFIHCFCVILFAFIFPPHSSFMFVCFLCVHSES